MKVVDLGKCRDFLADWEEVRKQIVKGRSRAFAVCLLDDEGCEAIFLGGQYKLDKTAALHAAMNMSMALNRASDEAKDRRKAR